MDNEEIFYENNLTFDRIINFGWDRKFSFNENVRRKGIKIAGGLFQVVGCSG